MEQKRNVAVEKRCNTGSRGHSFRWFRSADSQPWDDPPADTECSCCPKTYREVKDDMHFCPGAWALHRDRLAFTKALQSPGGQL